MTGGAVLPVTIAWPGRRNDLIMYRERVILPIKSSDRLWELEYEVGSDIFWWGGWRCGVARRYMLEEYRALRGLGRGDYFARPISSRIIFAPGCWLDVSTPGFRELLVIGAQVRRMMRHRLKRDS